MLGNQYEYDLIPQGVQNLLNHQKLRKVLKLALGHTKDSPQAGTGPQVCPDSEPNKTLWLLLRCCVLPPTLPSVCAFRSPTSAVLFSEFFTPYWLEQK